MVNRIPTDQDCRNFLSEGVDVVYSAETFYNPNLPDIARRYGVKTILHINREFLDLRDRPDLWAAPSMWHFDEVPEPRIFLPVPIDLGSFPARSPSGEATRFVHVIGRPAVRDRNGTADLLDALTYVQTPIELTVHCQDEHYVSALLASRRIPRHIHLNVRTGDVPDHAELYAGHDVLLLPRRFAGLCLPANEALGAGLPVVMTDVSPNSTWLPADWLVPAESRGSFMAKTRVEVYSADHRALAAKIDQFATDPDFYQKAAGIARDLAEANSWQILKPLYEKTFADL
ncbi:glycosyltransferase [Nocardia sp. NPDC049149]|uniref:glycosyltransferase n=1 Tax=Nocardia sp. NPDC049149 TaxID=3364315 RepID=UPI00371F4D16